MVLTGERNSCFRSLYCLGVDIRILGGEVHFADQQVLFKAGHVGSKCQINRSRTRRTGWNSVVFSMKGVNRPRADCTGWNCVVFSRKGVYNYTLWHN